MPAKSEPQRNHLLAALSPEVQGRLFPYLELVLLPLRGVRYESGRAMRHVYFPTDTIISLQYVMENGASTTILVVGNEGRMGISLFMGGESTPSRSLVQTAGYAYRLPGMRVEEEFSRHGQLLVLMLRYTQALITQIAQTAVCNRHHSIDQQLCRWLLLSMDRLPDSRLTMTQVFISSMLGVRREGMTQSASKFQQLGVISYKRGPITVLDRPRLEALSCECYEAVRTETDLLLAYLPQRQVIRSSDSIPTVTLPTSETAKILVPERRAYANWRAQELPQPLAHSSAGVALLAAGTVIKGDGQVKGLTTGVGLWLAGAIGVAAGAGMYAVSMFNATLSFALYGLRKRPKESES